MDAYLTTFLLCAVVNVCRASESSVELVQITLAAISSATLYEPPQGLQGERSCPGAQTMLVGETGSGKRMLEETPLSLAFSGACC